VTVPFAIPVADLAEDPATEMTRLVKVGKDLAERLVEQKARDWFRSRLQ
jgi:hypothetical protein